MISLYTYRLKFKKPFITGHDTYTHRKGALIRYHNNSMDLWSEAAPLPGFSPESLADVTDFLGNQLENLNFFFTSQFSVSDLRNALQNWPKYPSLQFALSYLGIRILAFKSNKPPEDFLPFNLSSEVKVNDIFGISDEHELQKQVKSSYSEGFRTIKIKANKVTGELVQSLKNISGSSPGLTFRFDANRSWPMYRVAEFSSYLSDLRVEYIEEPSVFSDLSELKSIFEASQCPIALDESVQNIGEISKIRRVHPNIYLVIKPALLGNLFDLAETIEGFESKRHRIVISTLLESKIGREMTAFTAATLGDPALAHGLYTGKLFSEDLLPDFSMNHDVIQVTKCIREKKKPIRFEYLTTMNGIYS